MAQKAADDFGAIAARLKEIEGERPAPAADVVCELCEGGGWVMASYQGATPPNFEICRVCFNPNNLPSP
jgi:hypothetical protein